jgi:glyoxylase-like metal-dependent hydrolase (beta-lactamase superfamily II)
MSQTPITDVTPAALKARLDQGHLVAILDVRNAEEFTAGTIEGRHPVPTANIPYFDFIEDPEGAIARMPFGAGVDVAVACGKGGSSAYVAEVLREHGFGAMSLTGGMIAWGDAYSVHPVVDRPDLTLLQFDRYGKGCLSYLIGSGNEAIVVDPGRHYDQYVDEAACRGWRIVHVVDTHLHADHISGAVPLAAKTGAKYHLHNADSAGGKLPAAPLAGVLQLGDVLVEVVKEHTPGHTPGSTSLIVDGHYLISGDTLFVNSVGRPDLGGHVDEWAHDLYWSLVNKIRALDDETLVLPAHYASQAEVRPDGVIAGSLGRIRENNPALNVADESAFIAFIKTNMVPQPETYGTIRRINLMLEDADEDKRTELELGKNQCAASRGH